MEHTLYIFLDPIQKLFLESVRSGEFGGLENASPVIKAELDNELDRLAKQVITAEQFICVKGTGKWGCHFPELFITIFLEKLDYCVKYIFNLKSN